MANILKRIALVFLSIGSAVGMTHAALKVGDLAPDVSAPLSDGTTFHMKEWLAKAPLVLYFYPKDDTPGCTKEACAIRDDFGAFRNLNATVVGSSFDSIKSHQDFIKKYNLPFPLIADEEKTVAKAFKVSAGLFAKRATFIIGKDGKILYVNPSVDPKTHSQEIRDVLSKIK